MFDLFVSYRHADADDVRAVVQALRTHGLAVWQDESDIETFASIQRHIEQGLNESKAMLVWYSARYPESLACQWELTRAFIAAREEGDPRARILLVNPESSNGHVHPIELRDALYACAPRDAAALEQLASAARKHVAGLTRTLGELRSRTTPRWYGIAGGDGSNRFFGRLREMWAVHSGLWSSDVPIITNDQRRPLVRLVGMGGSGKSLTAEMYAIRFAAAYPGGIFWLRAFGHDSTRGASTEERAVLRNGQVIDFAQAHGVPTTERDAEQIHRGLGQVLLAGGAYLWVVDDLASDLSWQEVQSWLAPSANGHTLVTTRSGAFDWAGAEVEVGALDEAAAIQLLTYAGPPASDAEQEAARQLARDLDYHPLALELAAVAARSRGFDGFRNSLNTATADAMDFAATLIQTRAQTLPHRQKADLNLSQTLLMSVNGLPERAKDVLRLAAQLAPVNLSSELVARTFANADQLENDTAHDAADLAMAAVAAQSLAREPSPGNILVHTLVARAMRFRDTNPERAAALRQASLPSLEAILGDDIFDARLHAKLVDPIAHSRVVLAKAMADAAQASLPEIRLLDALSLYDSAHGNYGNAVSIADCLIEYNTKQGGAEHPHTLTLVIRKGRMQRLSGDLAGALSTARYVLETAARIRGDDDPQTVTGASDMALVLVKQGDLAQARALQDHVLAQRLRGLGPEDPETLTAMNNLATTLAIQGDFAAARPLQERVLELRRKVLGPQHAETLEAAGNLATTIRSLGDVATARGMEEELLQAGAAAGEDHPHNLTTMNNLAASLHASGNNAQAREVMQKVITLRRRQIGEMHPDTLASTASLGAIMCAQGDYASAREVLEALLPVSRQALGAQHPTTLSAAFHLVIALVKTGDASGRIREILAQDLALLLDADPSSLPIELQQIRVHLEPILERVTGRRKRRSFWRWFS